MGFYLEIVEAEGLLLAQTCEVRMVRRFIIITLLFSGFFCQANSIRSAIGSRHISYSEDVQEYPYDAQVQYLESTGTEWIDTKILGHHVFGLSIFVVDVATHSYNVFIANETSNDFCIGSNNGSQTRSYLRIRSGLIWLDTGSAEKDIIISDGNVYVDGVLYGTYDKTLPLATNNNRVTLFAKAGGIPSQSRISYCRLFGEEGELLFDAIVVRKDGIGYMYDLVSGELFGNKGSGDFLIGPDI